MLRPRADGESLAGVAPGSETWTHKEITIPDTPLGTVILNVVTPTLTAYLPEKSRATGTGIVIAPGGVFVALAFELEGQSAARWLQERGIAAFVLKYRTVEKRQDGIPRMDMDTAARYGIADGIQALRVVRQHAPNGASPRSESDSWASRPAPWSPAGRCSSRTPPARPAFAAMIYGGPFGVIPPIPANLHPCCWPGREMTPSPSPRGPISGGADIGGIQA
jgi:hypothetical protein